MRMWITGLAAVLMAVAVRPTLADAQTRLTWPPNTFDIAQYLTAEECLAATLRIRDSVDIPHSLEQYLSRLTFDQVVLAPPALDAARKCSARWTGEAVDLEEFGPTLTLFLYAQRDHDAEVLIRRRLATLSPNDDSTRAGVFDSIASTYLTVTPFRLGPAEQALDSFARIPRTTARVFLQFERLGLLLYLADVTGDTARARRAAERISGLASTVTEIEKGHPLWQYLRVVVYRAYDYLTWFDQLDSLRVNNARYAALVRANWMKASDERRDLVQFPVGEQAKPIESEFWFSSRAAGDSSVVRSVNGGTNAAIEKSRAPNPPRPTAGRISLMFFLTNCHQLGLRCWDLYATGKRIHQDFPDVELTIVTQTTGYFLDQEPPPPAAEAELLRQWWLDFHEVPAMLAVTQTQFWRLPEPDRRRIDEPVTNITQYSFGSWPVQSLNAYLVDRDGTIIHAGPFGRETERRFRQLLTILKNR